VLVAFFPAHGEEFLGGAKALCWLRAWGKKGALIAVARVTPTFCIIKFCQARSVLGCILKIIILRKRISQINLG
jgi:hypothetical protein